MKPLLLNQPGNYTFEEFCGSHNEQIALMLQHGIEPVSVRDIFDAQLGVLKIALDESDERDLEQLAKDGVPTAWLFNNFDSGNGAFRRANGELKITRGSSCLWTPSTEQLDGYHQRIALLDENWHSIKGLRFTNSEVEKYTGVPLDEKAARTNPILLALAENEFLLFELLALSFDFAKYGAKNPEPRITINAPRAPESGITGQLWSITLNKRPTVSTSYSILPKYPELDAEGSLGHGLLVGKRPTRLEQLLSAPPPREAYAVAGRN